MASTFSVEPTTSKTKDSIVETAFQIQHGCDLACEFGLKLARQELECSQRKQRLLSPV